MQTQDTCRQGGQTFKKKGLPGTDSVTETRRTGESFVGFTNTITLDGVALDERSGKILLPRTLCVWILKGRNVVSSRMPTISLGWTWICSSGRTERDNRLPSELTLAMVFDPIR